MPALRITDYERSQAFYVDGLGFTIEREHRFAPGMLAFLTISRDGLSFYLTEHACDCQAGGLVFLYVPDVDAWHEEWRNRGVPIHQPPANNLPGLRDMTVVDPDGNKICILTRLGERAPVG
ncbi:MAG: glyoxalase superfamily protein [Acidobacteria bacterium]|nr:glyoxalase superfamily protein [Acidobacteriota bacterium]